MTDALPLRSRAEAATANLAALLARAEQLAAAVMPRAWPAACRCGG